MTLISTLALGCGRVAFEPLAYDGAAPCVGAAEVEAIVHGDLLMSAVDNVVDVPLGAVPLERTVLFVSMRENEPSPEYGAVSCQLLPALLHCERETAGTDYAMSTGEIHVHWSTVTFSRGLSVQRGVATMTSTFAIAPVNPGETFVVLGGNSQRTGMSWGTDEFVRGRLVDGNTLGIENFTASGYMAWQVVSLSGASVQRGELGFGTANAERLVTIQPVDRSRSIVLTSHMADTSTGPDATRTTIVASFVDDETIVVSRSASGIEVLVAWEVVTLPFSVTSGSVALAAGMASTTLDVPGLRPESAVALASNQALFGQATGSTDVTSPSDLVGEGAATIAPVVDGVAITRSTSTAGARFYVSAIDFARARCP